MVLFNRHFAILWHGQLLSQLGNQAFLIATTFYLLEGTGSASLVAAAMAASTVPLVLLAPLGGTVADRHSRRAILVLTDLARAVSIGGLALLIASRGDAAAAEVGAIVAVAAFNGAMSALFTPALQALVPDLVPGSRLAAANALNQMSRQAAALIGQAIGGVLYVLWGPVALLLADSLSFAYAGAATWLLPRGGAAARPRASVRTALEQYAAGTRAGIAYVRRHRGLTAVLAIFAAVNCLFMPVFVLLPFFTSEVLGAGPAWYGFLLSGAGLGALAGSAAAAALRKLRPPAALVRHCLGGVAASVLLLSTADSTRVALVVFIAIGALSSIINVTVMTALQTAVAADMRGRVMALAIALSTAAAPIGMALGGVLGDALRGSLPLVFAGCGIAIAIVAGLSWVAPGFSDVFGNEVNREVV